jgi:hypothetical protein
MESPCHTPIEDDTKILYIIYKAYHSIAVNYCWSSPAQSFLVSGPVRTHIISGGIAQETSSPTAGSVVCYAVCVVSKETRRILLPRTSCLYFIFPSSCINVILSSNVHSYLVVGYIYSIATIFTFLCLGIWLTLSNCHAPSPGWYTAILFNSFLHCIREYSRLLFNRYQPLFCTCICCPNETVEYVC